MPAPRWQSLAGSPDQYWSNLGIHIAVAGGLYPVVVMLVWVPFVFFSMATGGLIGWTGLSLVVVLVSLPFSFGVGFLLAGTVACFALLTIAGVRSLLDVPAPQDRVAMASGAIVAAIATLPLTGAMMGQFVDTFLVLLHVAGAVAFGQMAGAISSLRDLRRRSRKTNPATAFQISIWQIMAAMVPLAIVFSLLRVLGPAWVQVAIGISIAVALHFATRRPVAWLVNRWADRQLRRRREQRLAARST